MDPELHDVFVAKLLQKIPRLRAISHLPPLDDRPLSGKTERGLDHYLHGIRTGGDIAAATGPVCMEELATGFVDAFVGVGTEVIALGLQ